MIGESGQKRVLHNEKNETRCHPGPDTTRIEFAKNTGGITKFVTDNKGSKPTMTVNPVPDYRLWYLVPESPLWFDLSPKEKSRCRPKTTQVQISIEL